MIQLRPAAEEILRPHVFDYDIEGRNSLLVEARDGPFFVAHFRLDALQSNPFYVYSWGVKVDEDFQGLGIGQELLELRLEICTEAGAHTYFNVVNWENDPQVHIMRKYGLEPVVGTEEDGRNTAMWARPVGELQTETIQA